MVAEPYEHLPQRGEQEQAQPGRLPRAAPGAQLCPSETSARCCVPRGAPTGEGGFGTQSPAFSRNHKLEELCSLETENLFS